MPWNLTFVVPVVYRFPFFTIYDSLYASQLSDIFFFSHLFIYFSKQTY